MNSVRELPQVPEMARRLGVEIWKTVVVNFFVNTAWQFEEYLERCGCKAHGSLQHFLQYVYFPYVGDYGERRVVLTTPRQLGFTVPVSMKKLCEQAVKMGLKKCTVQLALNVRTQFMEQVGADLVHAGMEQVEQMHICYVRYGNDFWACATGLQQLDPDSKVIFRL